MSSLYRNNEASSLTRHIVRSADRKYNIGWLTVVPRHICVATTSSYLLQQRGQILLNPHGAKSTDSLSDAAAIQNSTH